MTESLIVVCEAFATARQLSRSRIATLLFNDGKALDRIAAGGDVTTRSFEKAMRQLDENWPEGTPWPKGVDRPSLRAVREDMHAAEAGRAA